MNSRTLAAQVVVATGLVAANLWLGLEFGMLPALGVWSEVAVSACFVAGGLAAWWLRPRSRTGVWLFALGLVSLLNNPYEFRLPTALPGHGAVVLLGGIMTWLQYAIAAHVLLGYPTGRLSGRLDRALVGSAFVLSLAGGTALLITQTPDPAVCAAFCLDSPLQLVADRSLYLGIRSVVNIVWLALALALMVLLVRRIARATPPRRRVLGFATTMFGLSWAFYVALAIAVVVGSVRSPAAEFFRYSHQWAGVVGLPGTFFFGLLRERLAFASVGLQVGRLVRVQASEVETTLREVLHDKGLRVAFPTGGDLVDVAGRPFEPPSGQAVTLLGDPATVALVHDPALLDDRELLEAAAATASLALDNARLHAELRVQLAEVRASRQRLAAAADHERQRLERDLHDGAQQRFLGIGLALRVLRGRLEQEPDRELVDELEHELRAAIRELRDLAQGIRPAVLTDQGLLPAIAGLARRAAVRVALDLDIEGRLDPVIEATAYYFVSEALQNTVKHSAASDARITAVRGGNSLVIIVADDGRGGADPRSGTGLGGLADRVNAVGGNFVIQSPPGGGTTLRVELPCG
ncbi:sensor histidine kinase [Saccharothrix mutabilis subsp. capreolus]